VAHPHVLEEVEGYKNILFFFLRIPNSSFQEVEGWKHNLVSLSVLDLDLARGLCQTVGDGLLFVT
jgi:hypothetical protein